MLIWAHTGRSHVRLPDGQQHRIDEGTGIWLPAGQDHELWTEPGSLTIPAWVPAHESPQAPSQVTRFTVAAGWRDWLIHHFVLGIGPMTSSGYTAAKLLDVLGASTGSPVMPQASPVDDVSPYPRMPQSVAARAIAEHLLRNPTFEHTVDDWASTVASSPRSIRREFLRDTGLTFAQWRTRVRLAVAREFLAAGYDVEHAAAHAGFGSRSGLTRAFREHYNTTPREFAHQATGAAHAIPARVTSMRQIGTLLRVMGDDPESRPELPATYTTPRVNDFHVLAWTYRGRAWARVNGATHSRRRGDAIWLPAGIENETGWQAGSLGVPIGDLRPEDAHFSQPLRAYFPPAWDTYLLYCSVSAYTGLRPDSYDPRHILELFGAQLAAERARTVPMPKDPRARAVAAEFIRRLGTANTSKDWDVPGEIHSAFRDETGMTFASWRQATRMRVARDMLREGAKPSSAARRVGYSQLSNFSRDFSRFYGTSPRNYQGGEGTGE
ncbi:MAG: helix-turn-helix transcriptional regulator [Brachybacterium sp.]